MKARLFVLLQALLPHHLLGRLVRALTRVETPWLKNALIALFVRRYRPQLAEALEPDPFRYVSFNAFFTRMLAPGARPQAPDPRSVTSPCDAELCMADHLAGTTLLQAKGHRYTLEALLAGQSTWVERLRGGAYATLYLAPRDYHRIHMPLAGRLCDAWHVPGRLFSVNAATAGCRPRLFARNERIVCAFESEAGPFVLVMVGALFVGSMQTIWHGLVTPRRRRAQRLRPVTGADAWQPRGAELGRFNMGSTVILLLPPETVLWDERCRPGTRLRVGESLGALQSALAGTP